MAILANLLIIGLALSAFRNLLQSWRDVRKFPKSLPWAGRRKELFSRARACIREYFAGTESLKAGYDQYNRKGLSFVVPDASFRPQAMIPPEHLGWFVEQPESIVAARGAQVGRFALPYLVPTLNFHHDMYMAETLRKELTRNLPKVQPDVFHDMRESVEATLGTDYDSWKEMPLFDTMSVVVFKSISRVLLGQPLCHNNQFLESLGAYAKSLGFAAVIVGQLTPQVLKPVLGYALAIPIFVTQRMAFRYLVPEIKHRMATYKRKKAEPGFSEEEPKDMLMWSVMAAVNRQDPKADRPEAIAERILFFMLGAIHTSIITISNTLLDILSSPEYNEHCSRLREEVATAFPRPQDWEDHSCMGKLVRTDSAIRESSRMNPVLTRTVLREVVGPNGLHLPDGPHLPKGTWVGVSVVGVHHDERFYTNPEHYEPFRFVDTEGPKIPQETEDKTVDRQESPTATSKYRKFQGLSTVSDSFLGFGYGRHSCPGRWLAASQLKLLLAFVVMHYDFKPLESRPKNIVFGDSIVPPQSASVELKRRRVT